jgi:hypothetical protein
MKAIIDIPKAKAAATMAVLQLQEIKESVKEMNEIKSRKKTLAMQGNFFHSICNILCLIMANPKITPAFLPKS